MRHGHIHIKDLGWVGIPFWGRGTYLKEEREYVGVKLEEAFVEAEGEVKEQLREIILERRKEFYLQY